MCWHGRGVAREASANTLQAMRDATEVVRLRVPCGPMCEVLDGTTCLTHSWPAVSVNATALVMASRAPQAIDHAIQLSVAGRMGRRGERGPESGCRNPLPAKQLANKGL